MLFIVFRLFVDFVVRLKRTAINKIIFEFIAIFYLDVQHYTCIEGENMTFTPQFSP